MRVTFRIAACLLISVFVGPRTRAQSAQRLQIDRFGQSRLGEPLKQFKHRFPQSRCHRRATESVRKEEIKREWLQWIDCAADLPADQETPFRQTRTGSVLLKATFFYRKLVAVEYLVEGIGPDTILNSLVTRYGTPTYRIPGDESFRTAIWVDGKSQLELEQIEILATRDASGKWVVGKVPRGSGTSLRLRSTAINTSEDSVAYQPRRSSRTVTLEH